MALGTPKSGSRRRKSKSPKGKTPDKAAGTAPAPSIEDDGPALFSAAAQKHLQRTAPAVPAVTLATPAVAEVPTKLKQAASADKAKKTQAKQAEETRAAVAKTLEELAQQTEECAAQAAMQLARLRDGQRLTDKGVSFLEVREERAEGGTRQREKACFLMSGEQRERRKRKEHLTHVEEEVSERQRARGAM